MIASTGELNASLLEIQADAIDIKRNISIGQQTRFAGETAAKTRASIAKSGQSVGGSALAVMLSTQKQLAIDKAISDYDFTTEKNYTLAEASAVRRSSSARAGAMRRQGRAAETRGYVSAFSTMLKGASSYAQYSGMGRDMGGGGISQYGNVYGKGTPRGTFDTGTYSKFKNPLRKK
jgi:hypothetical protein